MHEAFSSDQKLHILTNLNVEIQSNLRILMIQRCDHKLLAVLFSNQNGIFLTLW